jgi:hypothetical protein
MRSLLRGLSEFSLAMTTFHLRILARAVRHQFGRDGWTMILAMVSQPVHSCAWLFVILLSALSIVCMLQLLLRLLMITDELSSREPGPREGHLDPSI